MIRGWCVTHDCSAFNARECHQWVAVIDCVIEQRWVVPKDGPSITIRRAKAPAGGWYFLEAELGKESRPAGVYLYIGPEGER